MNKTMRAAVVTELGKPLDIREIDRPEPGPGQILVRVMASGVCHTDLHAVTGDWPVKPTPPFIPGHEGVGEVAAIGAGVTGVREGDRVGVPWLYTACGHCEHCVGGWDTLCESQQNTGYSVNGGFADYVIADPDYVGHLPGKLDFGGAAPCSAPVMTVYKGLKETEVKPGRVAISRHRRAGAHGGANARAMGMRVVAVDVADDKLALAQSLGARRR